MLCMQYACKCMFHYTFWELRTSSCSEGTVTSVMLYTEIILQKHISLCTSNN